MRDAGSMVPVMSLGGEMGRLLAGFFEDLSVGGDGGALEAPAMNVWEDENAVHVEALMPGFAEKEIDVSVTGNELRIRAQRASGCEANGPAFHRREWSAVSYGRDLVLPAEVDAQKVSAEYAGGVLKLRLEKSKAALPHKIEVKGA